jgi:hypothetical protein
VIWQYVLLKSSEEELPLPFFFFLSYKKEILNLWSLVLDKIIPGYYCSEDMRPIPVGD